MASFATRTGIPCCAAIVSSRPMRASSASMKAQHGTSRPRVVRDRPARSSRTTRKSSNTTWVKCGLPAHSPIAQTEGALARSRSSTSM